MGRLCYRLGRTGEHFMEFAVPGFIKRYCTPNALMCATDNNDILKCRADGSDWVYYRSCGAEPCVVRPVTVIVNRSADAMNGPLQPLGMPVLAQPETIAWDPEGGLYASSEQRGAPLIHWPAR